MEKFRGEIARIKRHRLDYYNSLLDVIEGYIEEKPDITIETCKAVIEGLSKLILHVLKQEPLSSLNDMKFQDLFRGALSELWESSDYFDSDLARRFGSLIHYVGEVRNGHCDIGHGRASLKEQINDANFSEMIVGMTDSIGVYMLRKLDQLADKELQYEDNPEFNAYLDELYPLGGSVLYSRALFDQEPETYEIELGDYILENNPEE